MRIMVILFASLVSTFGVTQSLEKDRIDQLANEYFLQGVGTLREFLKLPNYGGNQGHIDLNARWCVQEFQSIGFDTRILTQEGVKHVFASKIFKKNLPTILFYLQIDGQPVDSSEWFQESPYDPVLKDCSGENCTIVPWDSLGNTFDSNWKIFARSASDSKGPAVAFLQSLRILQEKGITPEVNIKVIMDFQEELGSPKLPSL